ncbi:Intermediate filament protein, partial [Lunasporangiospora selenospora]
EAIVEELIKKAERQGRQNELRILKKSKSTLRREILSLEYQKTQYEVQEEENMIMPGRSTINITSSTVGHDGNKEFALYVIEVHQLASDGNYASGWIIARRYSEFFALHQQLKEKFSVVKNYELPAKRGFLKLQRTFVEGRRIGLERYLQQLLRHEDICQSQELRAFLSQENVALPQFSSSPNQTSILPYITTEGRNSMSREDEGKGAGFGSSTSDQSFFGNFFQPASSPSISPQNTKDGSNSMAQPYSGMDKEFATNVGDESLAPGDEEGFMKHIYQTVSEGLDDMFSGGPPNVLGNITKQLGNQMMQFSVVEEETDSDKPQQEGAAILEGKELLGASRRDTIQAPSNGQEYQRGSAPARTTIFQNSAVGQVHSDNDQFGQHQGQPVTSILEQPEGVTVLTAPVCDLFIELFELKEKNNWLRRQAMLIILQQVFGGAIERKLRDTIKLYTEESMLVFYVTKLRDTLWAPTEASNGTGREEKATMASGSTSPSLQGSDSAQMRLHVDDQKTRSSGAAQGTTSGQTQKSARTPEQKAQTKDQANRKLSAFLPELLGSMVGHQNARRGARRAFAAFQNQRLNQQLVYTILDEVVSAVWPELKLSEASTLAS